MIAGSLEIQLYADVARIRKDMDDARRVVGGAMGDITKAVELAKGAMQALGAVVSVGAFAHMVKGSIDAADNLNDLSKTTRIAIADLNGLKLAANQSGGNLEGIAASVNKLAMNMGKDAEKFKALGITAKDPLKALEQFADVFAAIEDPQIRAALGAEALGKSWQSAAPLLSEGGVKIAQMVERGKQLAGVNQEMADRADEFNDKMAELGVTVDAFKTGIASRLLPLLSALAEDMQGTADDARSLNSSFDPITETFRALILLGGNVAFTFRAVGREIGAWMAQSDALGVSLADMASGPSGIATALTKAAASGKLSYSQFKAIGDAARKDADDARTAFDAWEKKILSVGTAAKATSQAVAGASDAEKAAAEAAAKNAAAKAKAFLAYQEQEAAAKKELESYAALIASIRAKTEENKLELAVGENVTEGQKLQIKMDQELASGKLKLSAAHITAAQAALTDLGVTEESLKLQAAQRDVTKYIAESTRAREESSAALDIEYAMYGKTADARALAMVALEAETWRKKELAKLEDEHKPITDQIRNQLEAEAKARTLVGEATLGQGKALQYAAQLAEENKRFGLDYIMDEKARAAATLAIDDDMWQERIRNAGEGTEAQKRLQQEYSTWYQNQLAKPELERQKKMWESVEQTAHDTFISIFDSGKSAFDRLRDALKNGLLDLLYQMTLKKWIFNVEASVSGSGSTGGSSLSSLFNLFGSAGDNKFLQGAGSIVSKVGGMFGSESMQQFGDGMGMGQGTALRMGGGAYSSGSSMGSVLSIAGYIAAGMALSNSLYKQGWDAQNGSLTDSYGGKAIMPFNAPMLHLNTVLQKIGMSNTAANMFSGASTVSALFGRKNPEIESQGIRGTVSASGFDGQLYANILEKGGVFRSDKRYQQTSALDVGQDAGFDSTIQAMILAVKGFGAALGAEADHVDGYAKAIDLKLTGDAAKDQESIAKLFGDIGDELSNKLIPNLAEFSKTGETASATLQRLAGDFQATDQMAQLIGKSAKEVFGAVGMESAKARERLITLSGGVDVLGQQASFFAQNFLTEAERLKPVSDALDDAMASLGLSCVQTREQFKNVIGSLDLTTEAGAQQYTSMMKLAEAFAAVHPATEQTTKAIKSQADVLSERKQLQDQLDLLTMTSTELLAKQRDALDESNRALFDQIQTIQSVKDAVPGLLGDVDSAFSVLQKVVERQKETLQGEIDDLTDRYNAHKALSDALHSTLNSMRGADQMATDRLAAQAQIKTALAIAKAGGPLPSDEKSLESLKKSLGIVSQDASAQFATLTDYQRDFYTTQGDIASLADLTDDALSVEQQSLKALQEQVKALDQTLAREQEQIDILKGIDTTGLSIVQAIEALHGAIMTAQSNPIVAATSAINTAYQSALGRAPDASGLAFWQQKVASGVPVSDIVGSIGTSAEATIRGMYKTMLGRADPDAAGLSFWLNQVNKGVSLSDIGNAIASSDEAKRKQGLPGFAVGINRVPFDMPAMIHEDEAVVPAAFNPFNPNARANGLGGNTERLEQLVDRLTATVERQQQALDQIQRNTRRQADTLDVVTEGGNAMRTA
jgi:hypothetical protein